MPWLLITCGYPFSGKSTLARAAAERLDLTLVSVDDQHRDRTRGVITDREWLMAYKAAVDLARDALAAGRSVIFDSVGHTRRNRYRLRRLAVESAARPLILRLDVTVEEARARLMRNRANPVRADVPIESFERIVSEFEPPAVDEVQICFHPSVDVHQWVETTLRNAIRR